MTTQKRIHVALYPRTKNQYECERTFLKKVVELCGDHHCASLLYEAHNRTVNRHSIKGVDDADNQHYEDVAYEAWRAVYQCAVSAVLTFTAEPPAEPFIFLLEIETKELKNGN